jgi:AbrB family looped-hinge helix DNA binding protein
MPKITSRGRITIPKKMRDKHGLLPGIEVHLLPEGDELIIRRTSRCDKQLKRISKG